MAHNEKERFSALSAYERLDNLDYKYLAELAMSLQTPRNGLLFFKVHLNAQHFSTTEKYLFHFGKKILLGLKNLLPL
jgi:hypothetical protein